MRNTILMIGLVVTATVMVACGGSPDSGKNIIGEENTSQVDSLSVALHEIDSILNSGQLAHLDIYEIGQLKGIHISVQKLTADDVSTAWINFRKDCGGEYYYSWEDAILLKAEVPYLLQAINTMVDNKDREVDHEERYAYITKDNIRLVSRAKQGKNWTTEFSIDYHKSNSAVILGEKDVQDLISLILHGQEKLGEIE